ncbi:MAG: rRNA maturation RNase YbeY [Bacteroidia bacterium]
MILFFNEDIDFQLLRKNSWKNWIKDVIHQHQEKLGEVNYIFCSDEHLLSINQQYLNHDYYTDIITFPSEINEGEISGDLFISIDRVVEHSKDNHCPFIDELKRVMIHGILHLIGFGDKTETESLKMRELENKAMSMFHVEHESEYFKMNVSRETK